MTDKSSGTTPPGRPTHRTPAPAVVLPSSIIDRAEDVKLATNDVEQFLSQVWDEPAFVVPSHIGGVGPAYYARSEGHWIGLDRTAEGFILLPETEEADYGFRRTVKYALERGVA